MSSLVNGLEGSFLEATSRAHSLLLEVFDKLLGRAHLMAVSLQKGSALLGLRLGFEQILTNILERRELVQDQIKGAAGVLDSRRFDVEVLLDAITVITSEVPTNLLAVLKVLLHSTHAGELIIVDDELLAFKLESIHGLEKLWALFSDALDVLTHAVMVKGTTIRGADDLDGDTNMIVDDGIQSSSHELTGEERDDVAVVVGANDVVEAEGSVNLLCGLLVKDTRGSKRIVVDDTVLHAHIRENLGLENVGHECRHGATKGMASSADAEAVLEDIIARKSLNNLLNGLDDLSKLLMNEIVESGVNIQSREALGELGRSLEPTQVIRPIGPSLGTDESDNQMLLLLVEKDGGRMLISGVTGDGLDDHVISKGGSELRDIGLELGGTDSREETGVVQEGTDPGILIGGRNLKLTLVSTIVDSLGKTTPIYEAVESELTESRIRADLLGVLLDL